MVFGMDPYNYNIYFSIASLLIVLVAFVINASEEAYDSRQKQIFGFIIADAVLLNRSWCIAAQRAPEPYACANARKARQK